MALSWSKRAEVSKGLPNLGLGGTLVAAFVTSYFAAKAAGVLMIIMIVGWHTFYVEGLRVDDWKHGIMSNGQPLPFPGNPLLGLTTFILWILFIACAEYIAGVMPGILKPFGKWGSAAARLIGGVLLLFFAFYLYTGPKKTPLIHPVPIAALIGGGVLLCKGIASALRIYQQKDGRM